MTLATRHAVRDALIVALVLGLALLADALLPHWTTLAEVGRCARCF